MQRPSNPPGDHCGAPDSGRTRLAGARAGRVFCAEGDRHVSLPERRPPSRPLRTHAAADLFARMSANASEEREYQRRRALRALRAYFARQRWPRLMMSAVLLLTGGAGFLVSHLLLQAGVERMALRYPLAVLVSWGVFLVLVRGWVEFERRYFRPDDDIVALLKGHDPVEARKRLRDREWSVLDWFDFASCLDCGDEGCFVPMLLLAFGIVL